MPHGGRVGSRAVCCLCERLTGAKSRVSLIPALRDRLSAVSVPYSAASTPGSVQHERRAQRIGLGDVADEAGEALEVTTY